MERVVRNKKRLIALFTAVCMLIACTFIQTDAVNAASQVSYSWPTKCHRICGKWGLESGHTQPYHYGIDIAAARGAKVKAAEKGKVINAGKYGGYGYCVIIKHSNGQCPLYGHMQRNLKVKKGKTIKKGTLLGYVGGTGRGGVECYDPHLHFGIYKSKSAISKENSGVKAKKITLNPKKLLP